MKKLLTVLSFSASLLAASASLIAENLPAKTDNAATKNIEHQSFTAIYQAIYKGFPLQATHRLEPAGDDWYFSSIASGFFGQIEENATFDYQEKGITPKHYVYQRSILGQDQENEIVYNQTDREAISTKGNKLYKIKLMGGEIDQGTYILALRDDIARGIKEPCYRVLEADDINQYCFRVSGNDTIETALGKVDTVLVERVRKADSPRRTRFWFAPSLNHTLAKLEHQEQKGETSYSLEITYYKSEKIQ
jgi:hypothetical protein